jgi:ArsR family transcriptional regulator
LQGLLSPKLFKALSDPRRIALLIRLAEERGPCTVGQVAQGSGIDLSVVSRHLATLRDAGIIRCEKQGKEVLCRVQTKPLVTVLRNLADALEACCPESWSVELGAGVSPNRSPAGPTRPR